MTRLLVCGSAALTLALPAPAAATPLIPRDLSSLSRYREALVQLGATRRPAVEGQLRAAGGHRVSVRQRLWRVPSRAAQSLVPRLAVAGAVVEVEPNRPRAPADHIAHGDPLLPEQWWYARIGADRVEPPGPGKPVTVIDSGLDVAHLEFAGRPNTTVLNGQTFSGQREFHGTAVSSVVAAPANGIGVVGVYPQAALNSWDASPRGQLSEAEVIAGIEAAAARGPGVINLSLGGTGESEFESQAVADAFARGSIIVAAVGNEREEGSPRSFPANYPHVVTVASTDVADRVSLFSSASPAIDIAAPGETIHAAVPTLFTPRGFAALDGTSFSAPIVAGALAWIWTARPELEKTQVIELVRRSARDLGRRGRDADTGFGLLDIPRALALPPPSIDPAEPNDSLASVANAPPLTRPGRASASVAARLDSSDDPRDYYRVFVPADRRATVTLRSAQPAIVLVMGRPTPSGLAARFDGPNGRTLVFTNRARRGLVATLVATVRPVGSLETGSYSLAVRTAPAPR